MTDVAKNVTVETMVKLTPTETRVLADISAAAEFAADGLVKINTARNWPASAEGWNYHMSASPRTLASLYKKGLIEHLTQFWKGATCAVHPPKILAQTKTPFRTDVRPADHDPEGLALRTFRKKLQTLVDLSLAAGADGIGVVAVLEGEAAGRSVRAILEEAAKS